METVTDLVKLDGTSGERDESTSWQSHPVGQCEVLENLSAPCRC